MANFFRSYEQRQIAGKQGGMDMGKENSFGKKVTCRNGHENSFGYCKGTGVFIPVSMNAREPKPSKGTGVIINPPHTVDNYSKKKDEKKKKNMTRIKKQKAGKQTVTYVEVLPNVLLPQEWPYEY